MHHQLRTVMLIVSSWVWTGSPELAESDNARAKVDFVIPITLNEAFDLAHEYDIEITQLQHTFSIGNEVFRGFCPVDPAKEPLEVYTSWFQSYLAFLTDISVWASQASLADAAGRDSVLALTETAWRFEEAYRQAEMTSLKLDRLVVVGTPSAIQNLTNSFPFSRRIPDQSPDEEGHLAREDRNTLQTEELAQVAAASRWVPTKGVVTTAPSNLGGRFVAVRMFWDDSSGFHFESTFEPDFFLNNNSEVQDGLEPGTYLDRTDAGVSRVPVVEFAVSSLPASYLDIRLEDPPNEIAYTLGSALASAIEPDTWYQNYIRVQNGDANHDSAKLSAQFGKRLPFFCFDPHCIFGDPFHPIERIFKAWEINVPGTIAWGALSIDNITTFPEPPVADTRFDFEITGEGINPESAAVIFTGPGCPSGCAVPEHDIFQPVSTVRITGKAQLAAGDFKVAVRNGLPPDEISLSNEFPLTVVSEAGEPAPILTSVAHLNPSCDGCPPFAGETLEIELKGNGFDPSSVEVLIEGPGCEAMPDQDDGCVVPDHDVSLKRESRILAKVLLAAGTFNTTVRNANGLQSNGLDFVVSPAPEPPPAEFTVDVTPRCSDTISQVLVSWTESAGVVAYTLFITGPATDIERAMGTQRSSIHDSLPEGVTFSYSVVANDNFGNETSSGPITATSTFCAPLNFDVIAETLPPYHTGSPITFAIQLANGAPPFQYQWSGDASGTEPTATEVYLTPGTYTAVCTIQDNRVSTEAETRFKTIEVVEPPGSTGTIRVEATFRDAPWAGDLEFRITGSNTGTVINGRTVPLSFEAIPDLYTIERLSGGPPGARQNGVAPGSGGTLNPDDTLFFSFTFVDP